MLRGRIDVFDDAVADTAEYLRSLWPELDVVSFEVAGLPAELAGNALDRWRVLIPQNRIILYRLPIERMSKLHVKDELHLRMAVEACVLRAAGEYLGRDPWDLAPDRFRDH